MKEKKIGRIIILSAFVIILCLSKGIWFFAEKTIDSTNYENRNMSSKPMLTSDNYGTFAKDFTSYFDDNMQFRNSLISLNSVIDYFIYKKSSNDQVLIGEDNWLFYANEGDGNPIGSYQGTNLYTEKKLAKIAQNCVQQRDFLRSQGKEFVIFIAPNKERIYSEYMPEYLGDPADNYRVLQVYNYLKENTDLRIVYPYAELMDVKNRINENIYYKTDTHWNYIGGYVGASALLTELGIEMPSVFDDNIKINSIDNVSGDLAGMLNLSKQLKEADWEYSVSGYNLHDREEIEWDFDGMIRYHAANADPRTIYVLRDSFSSHMALYIGSQFKDSYFRHRKSYLYDDLVTCNPDIVVYQIVERYVNNLAKFSIK